LEVAAEFGVRLYVRPRRQRGDRHLAAVHRVLAYELDVIDREALIHDLTLLALFVRFFLQPARTILPGFVLLALHLRQHRLPVLPIASLKLRGREPLAIDLDETLVGASRLDARIDLERPRWTNHDLAQLRHAHVATLFEIRVLRLQLVIELEVRAHPA